MNHWIIAPIVLPALVAPLLLVAARHHLALQRILTIATMAMLVAIAAGLMITASSGQIGVYALGNWPAPFGIVLVLDRLSALMVLLGAVLALLVVLYSIGSGWDRQGRNFYPLMLFLMMGINGAFLTGDIFNLFVFFEVLLISSYGLMIHGGGRDRLRAGVQYVVFNLVGSAIFLFALGTLYAMTGTLNMADMALRVADLPAGDVALLRVGAVLLLLVFAVKAAIVPFQFWLPNTYAHAAGPVAALFAVLSKVGAYAILRVYTLIFGGDVAVTQWLLPAALVTLALGALGVLGTAALPRLVAFAVIASMGTLLIALSQFTPEAVAAGLYYLLHSTFAAALLFLLADLVTRRARGGLVAALFFAGAIAMAGMPPLSGFLGKLMILEATRTADWAALIWGVILVSSLIVLLGFARAGSALFWKAAPDGEGAPPLALGAVCALLGVLVLLTLGAGPVMVWLQGTAAQIFDTTGYIAAVLGGTG